MKKQLRTTLAALLSVLLILTCFVPAFAAVPKYGEQGGYLAIGDSIGRGCGAAGSYLERDNVTPIEIGKDNDGISIRAELDAKGMPLDKSVKPAGQYDYYDFRNVKGAYTTQVAEAIGCKMPDDITEQDATFWPLCYPGMTTAVTLDLMGVDDDGFSDKKLDYPYYNDMLEYFGYDGSFKGVRDNNTIEYVTANKGGIGKCGSVKTLAEKASLITVELGMCDVFYRTYRIASKGGMLSDGAEFNVSSAEDVAKLASTAIGEIYDGMRHWEQYYPLLIKTLRAWNPDATIVMVGAFNVVKQLGISDTISVPLGNILDGIPARMNNDYKKWEKEFGDNVIYADISNTEPLAAEKDWSLLGDFMDNTFAGTHPSQDGYDYITRQVLNAMDPDKEVTTDIVVDLGRFDKVDNVLVDGKKVSDYTMDGHVLTVKCNRTFAKNLTITVTGEDGKTAVQTYALSYSKDTGYTASRIYGTSDVQKTGRSFLDLLKSLFQKIIDFFKGLFK